MIDASAAMLMFTVCVGLLTARAVPLSHPQGGIDATRHAVVCGYAAWCHEVYGRCAERARDLQRATATLLQHADPDTLAAARRAWCEARQVYDLTEAFRFGGGPIEPLEPLLNSWPVDEAGIDYVDGNEAAGIIQDLAGHPRLGEAMLLLANQRGGEANVSVGWHAAEFLLWGQDRRGDGPGGRPATDFVVGVGRNAARRGQYLNAVTALLTRHCTELQTAWAPGADNHRRRFEADEPGALRAMLCGLTVLTAFELAGERLAVAYETRDQEQEQSCFSDTSAQDLVANQLGIVRVCRGAADGRTPGLLALIECADKDVARALDGALDDTTAKLRAIPEPLDQAMLGADTAPGRLAIRAALDALDQQSELLTIAARRLGFAMPLRPVGG